MPAAPTPQPSSNTRLPCTLWGLASSWAARITELGHTLPQNGSARAVGAPDGWRPTARGVSQRGRNLNNNCNDRFKLRQCAPTCVPALILVERSAFLDIVDAHERQHHIVADAQLLKLQRQARRELGAQWEHHRHGLVDAPACEGRERKCVDWS